MHFARPILVCALFLFALSAPATASVLTFNSASDYTSNFVQTLGNTTVPTITWNSGGFLRALCPSGGYPNPNEAGHDALEFYPGHNVLLDSFSVELDFRASNSFSGVGFFFGGGTSLTNKLYGQGLVDVSGSNDRVRFFVGRSMLNGTDVGGTGQPLHDTSSSATTGNWYHMVFQAPRTSPSTLDATISVYNGATLLYTGTETGLADTNTGGSVIGINLYAGNIAGQTLDIDNVNIIPEPATCTLVLLGGAMGLLRRQRR